MKTRKKASKRNKNNVTSFDYYDEEEDDSLLNKDDYYYESMKKQQRRSYNDIASPGTYTQERQSKKELFSDCVIFIAVTSKAIFVKRTIIL